MFKDVIKFCKVCDKQLSIKCNRDLVRKNFCSRSCNAIDCANRNKKVPNFYKKLIDSGNTVESNSKKGHPGESNPRWIKDRTKLKNKRCFYEEREFMADVIRERNYTCEVTGIKGGKLSVHHKNSVKDFKELMFERCNVVVIQQKIHKKFHKLYGTHNITEEKWNRFLENKEYL